MYKVDLEVILFCIFVVWKIPKEGNHIYSFIYPCDNRVDFFSDGRKEMFRTSLSRLLGLKVY